MSFARNGIVIGAIGALTLAVGSIGVATAANGGSLVLGHKNTATKTTTLTDKKGTPLSLVGKTSKPPLKVNSSKQVAKLNASLLDGKSATAIATAGAAAGAAAAEAAGGTAGVGVHKNSVSNSGDSISADDSASTLIASTGSLPAGTYFVASSTETNEVGTGGTFCYVGTTANPNTGSNFGQAASSTANFATESVATTVTLTTATTLGSYCFTDGSSSVWYNGSITALKITKSVS